MFFLFKQKTAYEMRISDWSSDVCSSDLSLLEQLGLATDAPAQPLRFPVQWVARHGGDSADDFRGYAGRVASGVLRPGDAVVVQPSGVAARVQAVWDRKSGV